MGEKNNVWNRYFRDKKRFADLFNGVFFQGKTVIKADMLEELSEIYEEPVGRSVVGDKEGKRLQRIRDVRMSMKTGEVFRFLALENQQLVNYAMPFRCMQYDTMEYSRQLDELRKRNQETDDYATDAERVGRIKKTDRLTPVYTLCLYHGEQEWDGPKSLKDMMNFGEDRDEMSRYFSDYPMHLYCLNEQDDFELFKTEIKKAFNILRFRKNKRNLYRELKEKKEYQNMDIDTLEVVSVMLDAPKIWNEREKYMKTEKEEEVNMCQAIEEWIEEERGLGKAEGKAEDIVELLEELGAVTEELCKEIFDQKDLEILKVWLKKAAKVESIEEFECYLKSF